MRESVSSTEFVEICFVLNKAEEVKQEKDVLEVNSWFIIIYPVYLTHSETYCFSVNHAGKDFVRYNLKVNGGKFGMDSLLQQKLRSQKKRRHGRQSLDVILWCRWSKPYFLIALCGK